MTASFTKSPGWLDWYRNPSSSGSEAMRSTAPTRSSNIENSRRARRISAAA